MSEDIETDIDRPQGVHECDICGNEDFWDDRWKWYGSYNDLDGGFGHYKPRPIVKTCSDECRLRAVENNIIPVNAEKFND